MLGVQARKLGLDHLEPLRGHEIVGRNRAIGQVVVDVAAALGLLGEGLAHGPDYSMAHPRNVAQLGPTVLWASRAK